MLKLGIKVLAVVILVAFVFSLFMENKKLHTELLGTTQKYEQLTENIAKLEVKYITEKQLLKKANLKFKNQISKMQGRIKVLSNATYLIREKARKTNRSDIVYKGNRLKYVINEIRFNNGPPVGYVLIFDDGRVVSRLYNSEFSVNTAISRDDKSGRYDVLSSAAYTLKSPSINTNGEEIWTNKPFPLKITGGTAFIDPVVESSKSKIYWWLPKYNATYTLNASQSFGIGMSFLGKGTSESNLSWRALHLGLQYNRDKDFEFNITPILWRPFKSLNNTYIGPSWSVGASGNSLGLGLQIGL